MEPRYLVITYSDERTDDIGPVLVYTYNYFQFYPVGVPHADPLPVFGYALLEHYPVGAGVSYAIDGFYNRWHTLEERSVGAA